MTSTEDGRIGTGQRWTPKHSDEGGAEVRVAEIGRNAIGGPDVILYETMPLGNGDPVWGLTRDVFELRYEFLADPEW